MQQLLQLNGGEWRCTGGKTSTEWLSNFKPYGGLTVVNLLSLWCGCRMFFHRASLCARARTSHGDHRMSPCYLLRTRSACLLYLCRSFGRSRAIKLLTKPPRSFITTAEYVTGLGRNSQIRLTLPQTLTSAVTEESGDVRPLKTSPKTCPESARRKSYEVERAHRSQRTEAFETEIRFVTGFRY